MINKILKKYEWKEKLTMNSNHNIWNEIVDKLNYKNLTISTMESCTGGGVANEITNIPGASSVLKISYITYSNEAKINLGVSAEVIANYTVYSAETAIEMAKAAKVQANSDIGIGITGQLGRLDPENPVDKLNVVWFAIIDSNNKVVVKQITVPEAIRRVQKTIFINEVAKVLNECI